MPDFLDDVRSDRFRVDGCGKCRSSEYEPDAAVCAGSGGHDMGRRSRFTVPACAAVVVVGLLLLSGCASDDLPPPPPKPVFVQPIETGASAQRELAYSGRVESGVGTDLGFMVQGRLLRVHVVDGEQVRTGQLLAELDASDYRIEQRQAAVAERTASADLARRRELAAEGILSPAAIELAEAEYASARAQREAADRQVAHTRLLAPYAGRVSRRQVDPGTVLSPGEIVVALQAEDGFDVVVELSDRDAARLPLNPALVARATLLSMPDAPQFALTYREHATAPEQQSRTYRLAFRGQAPEGVTVLPGMSVRVSIPDPAPETMPQGVARIPLSGLLSDADGTSAIWVVEDDQAYQRTVELLELGSGTALVRAELAAGASVVVAGARQLVEGQAVAPQQRK